MWLLTIVSLPHFRGHIARTALTLLGISLGVAAIVATTTVTDAVSSSFQHTIEATAGRADLQVTNGSAGVAEHLLAEALATPDVETAAALVEGFVTSAAADDEVLAVFGLDLLADNVHRDQLPRSAIQIPDDMAFVSQPESVAVPKAFAAAHGYQVDSTIAVLTPGGPRQLVVRGLVDDVGPARLFGGRIGFMDLPAAQQLLGKHDKVDRIDVCVRAGAATDAVRQVLSERFHGRARVEETAVHGTKAKDLLFSLRVALALASLIAAVVAFFIIYHTVRVSVMQRRKEIALLSALGVSRASLLGWLATEALVLGTLAAGVGFVIGSLLGRISLATFGSVASAWVRIPVTGGTLSASTLLMATAVGLTTTFGATLIPVWSVISRRAARLLSPVAAPSFDAASVRKAAYGALAAFILTAAMLLGAPRTLPYGPLIAFILSVNCLAMVAFALLCPAAAFLVAKLVVAAGAGSRGLTFLLAGSAISRNPAGPVAVLAAIVIGLAATLADASMIESFKRSWLGWLDRQYDSDVIVTGGAATVSFLTGPPMAETLVADIAREPGVAHAQGVRVIEVPFEGRPIVIEALDETSHVPALDAGSWPDMAASFWAGEGALVNDKLAHLSGLGVGDTVSVTAPSGAQRFRVLGVVSDFHNGDLGGITIARALFRRVWQDEMVNTVRVWVAGADIEAVRAAIQGRYGKAYAMRAVTAGEFRSAVGDLIDNAFALHYAVVLIALTVSVVGVANFLLSAMLDRRAELRTLAAVGVPAAQVRRAIITEGGLLGVVGVTVGLLAGAVVSRIIVLHSIPMVNGWHFDYAFPGGTALALCIGTVALTAAAGALPARLATRPQARAESSDE